jgi:hypothetical protein
VGPLRAAALGAAAALALGERHVAARLVRALPASDSGAPLTHTRRALVGLATAARGADAVLLALAEAGAAPPAAALSGALRRCRWALAEAFARAGAPAAASVLRVRAARGCGAVAVTSLELVARRCPLDRGAPLMRALLAAGAGALVGVESDGRTALAAAAAAASPETVRLLLGAGAPVPPRGSHAGEALLLAAVTGRARRRGGGAAGRETSPDGASDGGARAPAETSDDGASDAGARAAATGGRSGPAAAAGGAEPAPEAGTAENREAELALRAAAVAALLDAGVTPALPAGALLAAPSQPATALLAAAARGMADTAAALLRAVTDERARAACTFCARALRPSALENRPSALENRATYG